MQQQERINDIQEAVRVAIHGELVNLWTALPGIVQSYDATKGICTVQPSIQARVRDSQGNLNWVNLPVLVDVPVVFPMGGIFAFTLPIQAGDEALVIFASRCIDGWWQQGGIQIQAELRLHDLSDGFALVGPRSLPRKLANVSTTTAQLRTVDGTAYMELAAGGIVNILAPGGVTINGNVSITGTVTATGEGTFNGGHTVSQHRHGGVQPGAGTTGLPTG